MVSVQCDMMAEENCALGGHETRNIVCCARHHEELPCGTCVEEKEAVVAKQNVPSETEEVTMVTEEEQKS